MKLQKLKPDHFMWKADTLRVCIDIQPSDEVFDLLDGEVDIEIKKHRKKRSLSANGYAWVLIDRLSEALSKPTIEVYREAVKDIGGVSEFVCIRSEAVPMMTKLWQQNGLGWQVEELDSKLDGCTTLKLIYGSSQYNTRQMSLLIDHLKQDCEAIGIDTKTPEEIAEMLRLWDEKKHT